MPIDIGRHTPKTRWPRRAWATCPSRSIPLSRSFTPTHTHTHTHLDCLIFCSIAAGRVTALEVP
eukprot:355608-Pleurochrysis_carterae.AAC.2